MARIFITSTPPSCASPRSSRSVTACSSAFEWKFFTENGGTKVHLVVGYEVPKKLFGKFAEPFLLKLNEREAEMVLANPKDRLEHY